MPKEMNFQSIRLSHHAIDDFLKCPKFFQLRHVDKLRTHHVPGYFTLGHAIHRGLELVAQGAKRAVVSREIDQVFAAIDISKFKQEAIDDHLRDRQIAKSAVAAWNQAYPTDFTNAKIETEVPLEYELLPARDDLPPVIYTGTIDMRMERRGDLQLRDFKSTSALDDTMIRQFRVSRQFKGYMWLAHQNWGRWPDSFTACAIEKPKIRKKVKESTEQYHRRIEEWYRDQNGACFSRSSIMYDKNDLKLWLQETKHIAATIRAILVEHARKDVAYRFVRNCGACKAKFGSCEYLPICATNGNVPKLLYRKLADGEDQERDIFRV